MNAPTKICELYVDDSARDRDLVRHALEEEVVDELKPVIDGRNMNWKIGDLGLVSADAVMLKQVLRNLTDNAVKYSNGRDPAVIEIGISNAKPDNDSSLRTFFIRDNGAGADMKSSAKLFGVFQRLHGPDEFERTGAGLAIVKRIIVRHGGTARGEGEVGEGSIFYFAFPKGNFNG